MARGGARPGAGRKAIDGENRVSLGCMVRPSTREAIRRLAEKNKESIGATIDRLFSKEK